MKANALLIAKETSDSNATIAQAVSRAGLFLLRATDAKHAFELLRNGLGEIDLVIIDVDPGIHSMAVLEAITSREAVPPVIVVTGLEQSEMAPIARGHGAAACIGKPFTAAELLARIDDVCPADYGSSSCNCDAWGHPYPSRLRHGDHKCSGDCPGCASGSATAVAATLCSS
ncbi:MAG TPA: response regulator [Chthoniobacterales bacterium]|nr:response regulator [Chthoniobacterales bacterium]